MSASASPYFLMNYFSNALANLEKNIGQKMQHSTFFVVIPRYTVHDLTLRKF